MWTPKGKTTGLWGVSVPAVTTHQDISIIILRTRPFKDSIEIPRRSLKLLHPFSFTEEEKVEFGNQTKGVAQRTGNVFPGSSTGIHARNTQESYMLQSCQMLPSFWLKGLVVPWMLTHSYDTVLEEKNHDCPLETIAATTVSRRPYWGGSPLGGGAPGTGSEGGPGVSSYTQ